MGDDGAPVPLRQVARGVTDAADVRETVRALIEMMAGGGITELDVTFGDVSIRLRGGAPIVRSFSGEPADLSVIVASDGEVVAVAPDDYIITAPMIGTFYTSPSPSDPPFVRVGDPVEEGQTVGIIEAMKIMNEIAADRSGIVAEVLVANAQAVEYGSPLLRLTPLQNGLP